VLRRLHAQPAVPWLHAEVARRMAERLPIVRLQPQTVLAWGLLVGGGAEDLRRAYPKARCLAVEAVAAAPAPVRRAMPWPMAALASLGGRSPRVQTLQPDAVPEAAGELLWSNMGLQAVASPLALFRQWQRALAVDGFLMFSTLGPGSLQGLRDAYQACGWPTPHAPFVDMHDLGDMLVAAGFADPVMDQETITLTWASPAAALAELRSLGGNVATGRFPGLRTPRWRERLQAALQQHAATADGRIALSFEVVYGHAFRPLPRARLAAETGVALGDMRQMLRRRRT
jgi:malonyl-CoA O-methyltransferase